MPPGRGSVPADSVLQRSLRVVLHDDERSTALQSSDFEDVHDIRVAQMGDPSNVIHGRNGRDLRSLGWNSEPPPLGAIEGWLSTPIDDAKTAPPNCVDRRGRLPPVRRCRRSAYTRHPTRCLRLPHQRIEPVPIRRHPDRHTPRGASKTFSVRQRHGASFGCRR